MTFAVRMRINKALKLQTWLVLQSASSTRLPSPQCRRSPHLRQIPILSSSVPLIKPNIGGRSTDGVAHSPSPASSKHTLKPNGKNLKEPQGRSYRRELIVLPRQLCLPSMSTAPSIF